MVSFFSDSVINLFENSLWQKIVKFGVVGLSGLCIDFFVTWFSKEKIGVNKYVASTLGFATAVSSNFFLNYLWTFKSSNRSVTSAFGLFFLFALIGLALNNIFIYLLADRRGLNFYLSKGIAIAGVFLWNFSSNYFFNFHL